MARLIDEDPPPGTETVRWQSADAWPQAYRRVQKRYPDGSVQEWLSERGAPWREVPADR